MKHQDIILVTGAHGLVGSAVTLHLRSKGFVVAVPERGMCDLRSPEDTRHMFGAIRPDHVFHAAARVYGIVGNMTHQAQSYYENTLINTNVIQAAQQVGVKKITVMGTNAIYPYPPALPFRESTIFDGRPHASESGYAHAKRGMLAMLEAYEQSYGLEWAYLISCNLFGPHDKFDPVNGHVVPSLIKKFYDARQTGKPVVIWGDGTATRDFLYVKDLAAFAYLVMHEATGAINVAGGSRTISEIVATLSAISGVTAIEWDRDKPNGQRYREADLSRQRALGFTPQFTIEDGLRETWDWYCHDASRTIHD